MFSFAKIHREIITVRELPPLFPYGVALTEQWLDSIHNAPHLQSFLTEMREAAQHARETPLPSLTFAQFHTFEATGTRVEFEQPYFERRCRLAALALASVVDQTDEFIPELENLIWDICNEYTWALPACLPVGVEACEGNRLPPEQVVDLFAAETANALAETLFLLKKRLNRWIHYRIRREIERRVFQPLFSDPVHFHWEASHSNWASVCAGAVGMAALLLEEDRERLAGMIERVIRAMECFLEGYGDDGGCLEGISYWQYGFGYYVYFADMLYQFTDGRLDLLRGDKLRKIAEFPAKIQLGDNCFVNYSDSQSYGELNTGVVSRLANRLGINVPEMTRVRSFHADHCYRWPSLLRILVWTDADLLNQPVEDGTYYFQNMGCVLDRRRIGDRTIAFFAKGGDNAAPHNHNDLGHFIIHLGGESLLADLGMGPYTKAYFGANRYDHLHTSSEGHSVPIINGHRQKAGRAHAAKVIRCEKEGEELLFELDLTRAYDDPRLIRYERSFRWNMSSISNSTAQLELTDSFTFGEMPSQLEQLFISLQAPRIADGKVIWQGERGEIVMLYDTASFHAAVEALDNDAVYRVRLSAKDVHKQMNSRFTFQCTLYE